jgi:predicted PurR-regulated permease PerM
MADPSATPNLRVENDIVTPKDGVARMTAATQRTNRLLGALLLILLGGALYAAAAFFMPLVLALLLALTLSPAVRALVRRGMNEGLAAGLVVLTAAVGIAGLFWMLSGPFYALVDDAPRMSAELRERFEQISAPMEGVSEMAETVDEATGGGDGVQQVVVEQPGILSQVAGSAMSIVTTTAIVVVLTLFLLSNGAHFSTEIVRSFTRLTEKKRALRTVRDVEGQISRYLLTIAAINVGLGVAVGLAMWLLGMPTPLLWGAMAALLNFLPFVGSVIGVGIVGVVALLHYPTIGAALTVPLIYFACTAVEGQLVTPTIVGRRLRLNTAAVFIAVAFWSFLWSIPGALMAVPILVVLKVLCDNVEGWRGFGRFLSAGEPVEAITGTVPPND